MQGKQMISVELGQEVVWREFGCRCIVDQIIEHEDGNHEVALALNGRVYWEWLSELEQVDD